MEHAWTAALSVIERLQQAGFEAVLVGGAVRDYLMKRPFHDVDVATEALPLQVKEIFSNTVDVGIEHGTVLVLDMGEPIEVTTYRTESTYSDYRRPDEVKFVRSLREDLQRRDFTMNAIAMQVDGEVVDYFGGQSDIEQGVIRAVGVASERFTEDALRMLRAARFRAQLGFEIESDTFAALQTKASLIQHIAVERIAQELTKIFVSKHAAKGIEAVRSSSLAMYLAGTFHEDPWQDIVIESPEQGWAYFYCLQQEADVQVLSAYKCSNKLKAFAKSIKQLVELPTWNLCTYFDYELDYLLFAARVRGAFGIEVENHEEIVRIKKSLPIQSMQELAVTGKEIVEWSESKKGPWIRERLDLLKRAVLASEVANNREMIKEWYDAKFNKR